MNEDIIKHIEYVLIRNIYLQFCDSWNKNDYLSRLKARKGYSRIELFRPYFYNAGTIWEQKVFLNELGFDLFTSSFLVPQRCLHWKNKVWKLAIELPWRGNPSSTVRNIQNHGTAVPTLLRLINSVYHDLSHWRSNQRPQNVEPKLYNSATGPYRTEAVYTADDTQ